MTTIPLPYPAIMPGTSCTLGRLYHSLRHGGIPEAEALSIVAEVAEHDPTITPPIPPGAQPRLENGSPVFVTARGVFDADAFFVPRLALPRQTPAAPKAISVSPEERAVEWLAPMLDNTTKRDRYKAACMEQFKLSGRAFDTRVWPAARVKAKLPQEGKSGRPRKK